MKPTLCPMSDPAPLCKVYESGGRVYIFLSVCYSFHKADAPLASIAAAHNPNSVIDKEDKFT